MDDEKISTNKKGVEEENSSMADRLVFLRGNMTQKEFAKKVGINPNTLRNYETGRVLPNQALLATLCYYLNVDPEWILLGRGKPFRDGTKDMDEANKILLSYSDKHYERTDADAKAIKTIKADNDSYERTIGILIERNRLYKDNIIIKELYYRIMFEILILSGKYDTVKNNITTETKEAKDFWKEIASFFNKYKDKIKDLPSAIDILKDG